MSKSIIIVVILITSVIGHSQTLIKSDKLVTDIMQIDSLIRKFNSNDQWNVKMGTKTYSFSNDIHDSKKWVLQENYGVWILTKNDSLISYEDSSQAKLLCDSLNYPYDDVLLLAQLLIKNKFTMAGLSGVGDCLLCSVSIIIDCKSYRTDCEKHYKYFTIEDTNSHCMPDDCLDYGHYKLIEKWTDRISLQGCSKKYKFNEYWCDCTNPRKKDW